MTIDPERIHLLKVDSEMVMEAISEDDKPFEYRKNDRDFRADDLLVLAYWDGQTFHKWDSELRQVCYILKGPAYGVPAGYCVLGLKRFDISEAEKRIIYAMKKHERELLLSRKKCPVCYGDSLACPKCEGLADTETLVKQTIIRAATTDESNAQTQTA